MSELGKSILDDMQKIKNSLIELDKIALNPRVFTNEQYFKEMIEYEETEKNPFWENRVGGLKMMRDQAKHINDISKALVLLSIIKTSKATDPKTPIPLTIKVNTFSHLFSSI